MPSRTTRGTERKVLGPKVSARGRKLAFWIPELEQLQLGDLRLSNPHLVGYQREFSSAAVCALRDLASEPGSSKCSDLPLERPVAPALETHCSRDRPLQPASSPAGDRFAASVTPTADLQACSARLCSLLAPESLQLLRCTSSQGSNTSQH